MNYGIKQQGELIFCAECGRLISEGTGFESKYCFVCGNPLKIDAINQHEELIEQERDKLIQQLKTSSQNLKTDSLKKVLESLNN